MANVGYIRVSSVDQNTGRQLEGIALDRVFEDKVSGGTKNRPELLALQDYVRDGDTVHVHSIDRLARNLEDLLGLIRGFLDQGVNVNFLKENLTFNGEDNPFQQLQLQIIGAVAQFEREMIKERQREGIAKAKKEGKYKGRKTSIDKEQVIQLKNEGITPTNIAKQLRIARSSVYRMLKED
ncbi:recombinase family protein [Curvivirga sp.]|uniref:recombinase family protein n=1 Tax=Curvivirga sp. TaxID=2856848 RepID=UPI003B58E385